MRIVLALALLLVSSVTQADEIHVWKGARRLELRHGDHVVRTFRVALGGAPEGDKERRGDSKTPEGEFYVMTKNPRSSFHRFIGLSYPMSRYIERGLKEGLLTEKQAAEIRVAEKKRRPPPQNTGLGGDVGIHGGGWSFVDWTLGCVALTDEDAEWLYARVEIGDRIVVHP